MFANQRSKIFLTVMLVMIAACLAVTQVCGMGITEPSPRINGEGGDDNDMGTGPCGEAAKGPTTVTYTAGDSITVKWDIDDEYTSGGGTVSFFLMDSDTDEEPHLLADIEIESDEYEANLTLPDNVTCDNCTLQWVFIPAVEEGEEEMPLYQCADIEITQKDPSTGGGGGGGDGDGNGGGGGGTVDSGADTLYSLAPWALAAVGAFVINILA